MHFTRLCLKGNCNTLYSVYINVSPSGPLTPHIPVPVVVDYHVTIVVILVKGGFLRTAYLFTSVIKKKTFLCDHIAYL